MSGYSDDSDDFEEAECDCESCRHVRRLVDHIEGRLLEVWAVVVVLEKDGVRTPPIRVLGRLGCDAGDVVRAVKASARDVFDVDGSEVRVVEVGVADERAMDVVVEPGRGSPHD